MSTFTDVFGSNTVPPSSQRYVSHALTSNATFVWPYNYSGTGTQLAAITEISSTSGLSFTLPDANEVSVGEDIIIKNIGQYTFTILNADGDIVTTVASGTTYYLYVSDNSSEAGEWGVLQFGASVSSANASQLAGYGLKASGTTLQTKMYVSASSVGLTINTTYRASLLVHTGGTATYSFQSVATLGNDFYMVFKNSGTGTVTLDPYSSETIDLTYLQPGESAIIVCDGTKLIVAGDGRSASFNFTQLTKDISAGGTITLSSSEIANKLITFTGNPSADVTVVVPVTVNVYYLYSDITTAYTVTFKTSAGTGVDIDQGSRVIVFCDGTDVISAQSVVATTTVSLVNGSSSTPALNFATKTNTGIYKSGTQDLGIVVNGTVSGVFTSSGLTTAAVGNLSATNVNAALQELQEDIDTRALANGQLTVETNTGTSYTFVLTDAGKYKRFDNASATTVTIPPNSSVAFPTGTTIHIRQVGTGQVWVAGGSGVTITSMTTAKLAGPGATASVTKVDTNKWEIYGNLDEL